MVICWFLLYYDGRGGPGRSIKNEAFSFPFKFLENVELNMTSLFVSYNIVHQKSLNIYEILHENFLKLLF